MTTQQEARARSGSPTRGSVPPREVKLPTRPRRLGQWAATVLFVIISVTAAAWLWNQQGDQVEVLAVDTEVPAGHVLSRTDLTSTSVAGVDGAIRVAEVDGVIGSVAAVPLVPGQILTDSLLTTDQVPAEGQQIVGLQLDATRAPAELEAGDEITALAAPPTGDPGDERALDSPRLLAEAATVFSVSDVEGVGSRISLVVSDDEAPRLAAYGAAGRVALVQTPAGEGQ